MRKKNKENKEFSHFQELANEWWKPKGKFEILHQINPLRIQYIRKNIINENFQVNQKKILKNIDILDLGCGGGLICEPLAKMGANVTGIDFVKENINIAMNHAKKSNLKINYYFKNINSLKIQKKFDVIIILEVIEHIKEWEKIIKNIIVNLKPNGKIIFSTINRTFLSRIFVIFLAEEVLKWIPKNTHKYNKLVKPDELIFYLKKNNMKIIDISGLVYNPILKNWDFKKNKTRMNYFCTAQIIN